MMREQTHHTMSSIDFPLDDLRWVDLAIVPPTTDDVTNLRLAAVLGLCDVR